mmetsp:Transcript_48473/g.101281  ORF Transcript_48473/g.101281 Transcript_48473/m.101281 type:complete len:246 (+) Transcript_48473:179-916(+)
MEPVSTPMAADPRRIQISGSRCHGAASQMGKACGNRFLFRVVGRRWNEICCEQAHRRIWFLHNHRQRRKPHSPALRRRRAKARPCVPVRGVAGAEHVVGAVGGRGHPDTGAPRHPGRRAHGPALRGAGRLGGGRGLRRPLRWQQPRDPDAPPPVRGQQHLLPPQLLQDRGPPGPVPLHPARLRQLRCAAQGGAGRGGAGDRHAALPGGGRRVVVACGRRASVGRLPAHRAVGHHRLQPLRLGPAG